MANIENLIRDRAYAIWEREGRPEGRERQHWEQAAREVLSGGDSGGKPHNAAKPARASGARGRPRKAA